MILLKLSNNSLDANSVGTPHGGVTSAAVDSPFVRFVASAAGLLLIAAILGCADGGAGGWLSPAPRGRSKAVLLRATMDVAARTMNFDPLASPGSAGSGRVINAAIYGDHGVTVRLYNSPVVQSAGVGGKKTYSANVGIQNLLPFNVGDEQASAAPADTMGIYVFLNSGPTVTATSSPCGACTVTVKSEHGTLSFNASSQEYWFWPEILRAVNSGSDTTLTRDALVFEADTQVTQFSFDVLVSAPWPAPNETVWRVEYPGDSLPDTQAEPRWKKLATSGASALVTSGGFTVSLTKTKDSVIYARHDSIGAASDALMEVRLRLDDGGHSAVPQPGFAIDDNSRYIAVSISDSGSAGRGRVGFLNASGGFIGSAGSSDTVSVGVFRSYQLRKFGSDSATVWVDGIRRLRIAYTSLPLTRSGLPLPSTFEFGLRPGKVRTTTATWDRVTYQIGQATP